MTVKTMYNKIVVDCGDYSKVLTLEEATEVAQTLNAILARISRHERDSRKDPA